MQRSLIRITSEDLLEKIYAFKPNVFIVPDEWNDSAATIRNAKHWMNVHKPNPQKQDAANKLYRQQTRQGHQTEANVASQNL